MQDKSIDGALLALRKQIIRGDSEGLSHVEALLALREVHMPAVLPAKREDAARKGHMAIWVMLRYGTARCRLGALPFRGVVEHVAVHRPELALAAVRSRTGQALYKLKRKGHVVQDFGPDGCLWRLALWGQLVNQAAFGSSFGKCGNAAGSRVLK